MDSKKIGQSVRIRIQSAIQHPEQSEETHVIEANGRYIEKAGKAYLQYDELQDGQKIQSTVKLESENAFIMRTGAVKMRLPFSLEGDKPGEYGNAHTHFRLMVRTKSLAFTEERPGIGGQFSVAYELHAEGSLLGTYKLLITYSEGN